LNDSILMRKLYYFKTYYSRDTVIINTMEDIIERFSSEMKLMSNVKYIQVIFYTHSLSKYKYNYIKISTNGQTYIRIQFRDL